MTKKTLATWGILIVLLVSLFGTAAAQSGVTPPVTPTPTEQPGSKFFTHPVVQLLSAYFDREVDAGTLPEPTETVTPDPLATPDPSATPVADEDESGLGPIGEQIAAYHEEGMGFGVLVKIYAMAEEAKAACEAQEPVATETPADGTPVEPSCTPVTAEELVASFKSGTGMGALFKEYGKPAMLGVGHVKKAAEQLDQQPTTGDDETVVTDGTTTKDGKGQGQGKNNKPNNKGPKKDKGPKK